MTPAPGGEARAERTPLPACATSDVWAHELRVVGCRGHTEGPQLASGTCGARCRSALRLSTEGSGCGFSSRATRVAKLGLAARPESRSRPRCYWSPARWVRASFVLGGVAQREGEQPQRSLLVHRQVFDRVDGVLYVAERGTCPEPLRDSVPVAGQNRQLLGPAQRRPPLCDPVAAVTRQRPVSSGTTDYHPDGEPDTRTSSGFRQLRGRDLPGKCAPFASRAPTKEE